jgi:hypothetical protein
MGYYIRVLGKNLATISAQELREVALPAVVDVAEGNGDTWEQLTLKHKSGEEIAVVERNQVAEGKLGRSNDGVRRHRYWASIIRAAGLEMARL